MGGGGGHRSSEPPAGAPATCPPSVAPPDPYDLTPRNKAGHKETGRGRRHVRKLLVHKEIKMTQLTYEFVNHWLVTKPRNDHLYRQQCKDFDIELILLFFLIGLPAKSISVLQVAMFSVSKNSKTIKVKVVQIHTSTLDKILCQ